MADILVDERDVKFVLNEQLKIEKLCGVEKFSEFSRETFDMVIDAAQKLAENQLWPINAEGDRIGVRLEDGQAKVPESFHKAYQYFREGGWMGISVDPEHNGQGLPICLCCAAYEFFLAANLAFMAYPGLAVGAARVIQKFGDEEQRATYVEKMYAGEWGGTMCLTEPHAGSDVGAISTRAKRNLDGTFSIVGNKIFITGGDHDLTENIVHLVLARIEGAPSGTKGISIFIVPKKRLENGSFVDNDVSILGIEKKLGMNGSATCALNFGDQNQCIGYLIGNENMGMKIMFHMMNEARLGVALHGLSQASPAYMHSLRYARERIQGSYFANMKDPEAPKIPIIEHPDVRRMLMWMKSVTEGMRSLIYFVGHYEDLSTITSDKGEASKYQGMVDLLIPVCKAWCSDTSFRVTEMAVQIHGGYGYCREYPVEQFLRDVKITSIYEGTNGIQALDLVGRKLSLNQGAVFRTFMAQTASASARIQKNPRLLTVAKLFDEARSQLMETTVYFARKGMSGEVAIPVLYATPYLELFGDVAVGYMLLWQGEIADLKLQEIFEKAGANTAESKNKILTTDKDAAFYRGKIASAEFFSNFVLSLSTGKARAIMNGDLSIMEIPDDCFLRS
jgi:alkylation response protein AidB-like acyl-CoA dehydrogenase